MDASCHRKLTIIFLTAILANLGATKPCLRAISARYRHDVMTSIRLRGGSQPAQAHALWVSCQDPSSGRTYFYEMNSRLTSWVLPPGAVLYGKLGSNGQLEIAQHSSSETPVQTAASREETAVPVKAQDATMNTQSGPSEQAKAPSAPIPGNQPVPSQEATAISTAESKNDPGASQEGLQRDGLLHSTNQPAPTQAPQHIASQHEVSIVTPTAQPVAQPSLVQTPVQQREEQKHAAFTSQQPAAAQQVPQGATQGAHYAQGANSGTWKETIDPVSGRKYYYNTITRATSWHLPVDNQLALNSAGATRNSTFNLSNLARRFEDNLVNATRSVEGLWSRIGGLTKVFASSKKPADKPTDWYFDEEKQTWLKKNGTTSVNSEASEPNRQAAAQQGTMQAPSSQAASPHAPTDAQMDQREINNSAYGPWQQHFAEDGYPYWWNSQTGESQWYPPTIEQLRPYILATR